MARPRHHQPQPRSGTTPTSIRPRTDRSNLIRHAYLHRLPLVAVAACLSLAATACHSDDTTPAKDQAPSASAKKQQVIPPALSKQQALAEIHRYSQINNKANTTRDRHLLDTIEDGPLYAMSTAEYKQDEGLTKAESKPYTPWSYTTTNAKLYIPRIAPGRPRWFAAALSFDKNKAPSRLAVFAEQPQHERWEMVSVLDLDEKQLPNIALDADGYATALPAKSLAAGPDVLRRGVIDNFSTGGENSGKQIYASTKASKRQIEIHNDAGSHYGSRATSTFAGATNDFQDTYALKTTDGGALVFFSHTHTQTDTVANIGLQINPGKSDRAWLHDIPRYSITYIFQCNDAATVPAHTAPSTLLGYTCAKTDASGPPVPS